MPTMLSRVGRYTRISNPSLWVLSFGWLVSAVGFAASLPFIAIYFNEEYGISLTGIGLFFLAMAVVRSAFQLVGGELSDRMSRQWLLVWSQLFRAGSFVFIALSISHQWGFWAVAAGLLVNSMLGALFHPVANALVSDLLPPKERLDGYAITRSAGNLGWAIGPAIGGFAATSSYAVLFWISAAITVASALIFMLWLRSPESERISERFRMRDLLAIKDDKRLAIHSVLVLVLYLVVAQLIVPFSVYTVEMVGISKTQLGYLFTLNGLLVVVLQLPITRLLADLKLTTQLALGAVLYFVGYASMGFMGSVVAFGIAITVVTIGECAMSPPSLALTSRMAPPGRMGRYMGIFGFFTMSAWSLGPLYGGFILDQLGHHHIAAWIAIASLALVAAVGFIAFGRSLPDDLDRKLPEDLR
jgi:MFS family permease